MPQRAQDVIADTTVIHAEEIARSGAGSVADILQRQRGVEITRNGGAGAAKLAEAVWAAANSGEATYAPIYADDIPLAKKIETIAMRIYGADGIDIAPAAAKRLARLEELGYGALPICMAKTQYSLSHDATKLGRPIGFRVPVKSVTLAAGAGFITAVCGDMRLMPGLNKTPGGERIDLDLEHGGEIVGLF
jgi:formate--tetrahydrofolate ligase